MTSLKARIPGIAGIAAEQLVFLAWALFLIWPVSSHLTTRAVGAGDARHWLWVGWRLSELVADGHAPTRIPDIVWPYGANMLVADGALTSFIVMMWNFVASPTLAFNFAVLTALVANATAARHLARVFTSRRVVAIVCGLAFAGAPALTVRLHGHYNLLFAFPVVLLLAVAVRTVKDGAALPPLRVGLLLALAYASSGYYFFFGAVAAGVVVLIAHADRDRWWRNSARLVASAAVAAVVLSPFLVAKFRHEARERGAGARAISQGAEEFSADVFSIVLPSPGRVGSVGVTDRVHYRLSPHQMEVTSYPGLLPLLGVAGVVVLASPLRRPLLGAAIAVWLASLGPTVRVLGRAPLAGVDWLPMAWILDLPGMAGVRAPNRGAFVLAAVTVACLAASLAWAFDRLRARGRAALAIACLVVVAIDAQRPVNWSEDTTGADVYAALDRARAAAGPRDALIHLPNDCLASALQIDLQIRHRLPVIGCQGFDAAIPWKSGLDRYYASTAWAKLRCFPATIGGRPAPLPSGFDPTPTVEAVQALREELNVRFVVYDRVTECAERGESVLPVLTAAAEPMADDGRLIVFDLSVARTP